MHVEFAAAGEEWGGWRFGDLAVAICRAVEVVGPPADVTAVTARQPTTGAPVVQLTVPGAEELDRLRFEAANGEYVAVFTGPTAWDRWEAQVNGVRLAVSVIGADEGRRQGES